MTSATQSAPTHALKRVLRLGDLVLFNVVAVLGLRWVATSAKAGPSSLILWLLAALLFFIPQGVAVITLSSRFPDEGGVYAWTRRTYGEWNGFLCGWCYWINNVLYYPNLLISTAVIATYAIGKGGTSLGGNWAYVLPVALTALWIAAALNIVGLGTGKWLHNVGGVATYIPGVILILLGVAAMVAHPSANPITRANVVPDVTDLSTLNLWASIAFAFAGLELSSTMGEETANPRRDLPRAIVIAAPLIAIVYIVGTLSVLWLVPVGGLNIVSGFLQAIAAGSGGSPALMWLAPLAAGLYTASNVAGVGAWLSGPARVAFVIGLDRYFPPAFGRVHPTWRTPYVAILVQAALATVFLLVSQLGKGSTVEQAYLVLLDTQLLVYFIPYLYLFLCLLREARAGSSSAGVLPGGRVGATLAGVSGLAITAFAMIVAAIPPSDAPSRLTFAVKVIGGAAAFVALGTAIYWRARARSRA